MHPPIEPKVFVLGKPIYIAPQLEQLRQKGHTVHILDNTGLSREEVYSRLRDLTSRYLYDAVLLLAGKITLQPLDETFFEMFKAAKFITGLGAGYDSMPIDYLTSQKIIYANCPVSVSDPTATTTAMLILQTIRASTLAESYVRSGAWKRREPLEKTEDQRDLVIGIIGLGRIGKLVKSKVEALGMKVIYYNRSRLPPSEEGQATYHTLSSLLSHADLITLHTPLTSSTHHLLSDSEFKLMKDGVMIVNTSRGSVIDEEALVRAMKSGKVSRVGLDVFEQEPKVHPYLLKSTRAALLPHWGAQTVRAFKDGEEEVLDNYKAWLVNGKGNTPVNLPDGGWA